MSITIHEIADKGIKQFIRFPWKIYAGDPNWVPPLILDRLNYLNRKKNPFFRHATVKLFMAEKDGRKAGRIAAVVNENHNRFHDERTGFFGMFECIDDQEVANALFGQARMFLEQQEMDVMRGPVDLSTNDMCGLLIEGFDSPPTILMSYNPRYYLDLYSGYGLEKAKDLWAHTFENPKVMPERLHRLAELVRKRNDFTIRTVNMKQFDREVEIIKKIYNSAWKKNWGFVPMTDEEFDFLAKDLKPVVEPDILFIAEKDGNPVGFSLALPDMNQALRRINGRLLPFGLLKLLYYARKIDGVRIITLGVIDEFRMSGVDAVFYYETFKYGIRKGLRFGEASWILEDNTAMNKPLADMGFRVNKRYRIYEKPV